MLDEETYNGSCNSGEFQEQTYLLYVHVFWMPIGNQLGEELQDCDKKRNHTDYHVNVDVLHVLSSLFSALYNTRALFSSRMPVLTSLLIDPARVKKTEIHLFFYNLFRVMLQSIIDVFFANLKILRDMRRVSVVDFHAKGFRVSKMK